MLNIKQHLPGQGMTYSQRRRLINLLWAFVSNAAVPFIIGYVFALMSITYSFTEIATTFDKTGFGACIQPDFQETHAITGAVMPDINYTADDFAKEKGFKDAESQAAYFKTPASLPAPSLPDCKPEETIDSATQTCAELTSTKQLPVRPAV